ncbi:MAG TPA: hypothetical protein VFQ61_08620 [Polyangiaceae bacterium]|nr:hypothetical protein [Polyangiaceae bacterium]
MVSERRDSNMAGTRAGPSSRPLAVFRLVLWGFAAVFVGVGGWLFFVASADAAEEARRADTTSRSEATDFPRLTPGTATLLVGELVAREPVGPQGFVAYQKESYLRTATQGASKGRTEWMTLSVPPPLIAVKRGDVFVPICNRDYAMSNRPHRWQSDTIPVWRSVGDSTIRLSGFKAGDALTVDGVVTRSSADGAEPCLRAKAIFAGAPTEYVAELRSGVKTTKIVGAILAGFGLLALALGRVLGRTRG